MISLSGKDITLRALEPEDLDFLYRLENDPAIWEISGTLTPYSRKVLRQYLEVAHRDIYEVKQLRLAIVGNNTDTCLGLIDLFDFDPRNMRAGVGIVISGEADRNKGYGSQALGLLCAYAFGVLGLRQLFAGVGADNTPSLSLFRGQGFEQTGLRRDWIRTATGFQDEVFMQKINAHVH